MRVIVAQPLQLTEAPVEFTDPALARCDIAHIAVKHGYSHRRLSDHRLKILKPVGKNVVCTNQLFGTLYDSTFQQFVCLMQFRMSALDPREVTSDERHGPENDCERYGAAGNHRQLGNAGASVGGCL